MKNKTQQDNTKDLYQLENQELPPTSLDDFILNSAKNRKHKFNKWPGFAVAASILIVIPLVLQMQYFSEQSIAPEKLNTQAPTLDESEEVLTQRFAKKKPDTTSPKYDSISEDKTLKQTGYAAEPEATNPAPLTEKQENKIGSRMRYSPDIDDETDTFTDDQQEKAVSKPLVSELMVEPEKLARITKKTMEEKTTESDVLKSVRVKIKQLLAANRIDQAKALLKQKQFEFPDQDFSSIQILIDNSSL